jgi:plastocyanin
MRSTFTRGTAVALLPTLGMLVLAGCGNETDAGTQPSTTASPTASGTPSATPSTSPKAQTPSNTADPSGEDADVTIAVTIAGGKVSPSGATIPAKVGDRIKITATSDAHDAIHVHGYDKEIEVHSGTPATLTFTADQKGTFEIETHESGKLLAKLVVS